MLQTERINDQLTALRTMLTAFSAGLYCAMVGIVQKYDATKGTVDVQPVVEGQVTDSQGNVTQVKLALVQHVPVVYLGGGGFVATFPIQPGDECLVIFADRCIDSWWQSGGVQPAADPQRKHSLSDGIALVGPRSQARALANVSTTSAQLRSVDGSTYVEIAAGEVVNIVAPAGINLTGPVTVKGNLSVTGTTTGAGNMSVTGTVTASGDGKFGGHSMATHVHSGVLSGGANTGPAVG